MSASRQLPPLLVLTDRHLCAPRPLIRVVTAAVSGGARAVILREKDLPREERASLASELRPILRRVDGLLIVASDPTIDSDGVHLAATDPFPCPRPRIVGRSCHSAEDVQAAEAEGCDYVTVSPVYATPTKPGYGPPLGEGGARCMVRRTTLPAFLLGGLTVERATRARSLGATGVAVMGMAMRSEDPRAAIEDLLGSLVPASLVKGKTA